MNPNGLVAKLPDFDDFCHGDIFYTGAHIRFGKRDNYYANRLREIMGKPGRYNNWTLAYILKELANDVDHAWQVIAEKKAAA